MMGVRTEEHCLRSQVGIGSESDCLLKVEGEHANVHKMTVTLFAISMVIVADIILWVTSRKLRWRSS